MRPASVQKCVTAITALDRLGVDYQFSTRLYCRGDIDSTGVLHGSLYCVGGMDPLFGDANMRAFVRALREKGIRRITGDLLADKSMKDDKPMGEGWCWDDDDSNPPLSPLLYNRRDASWPNYLRACERQVLSWRERWATPRSPQDPRCWPRRPTTSRGCCSG